MGIGELVEPTEQLAVIAEDPAEDRVLEAAAAGGAEVVVSGDRYLLALQRWGEIRIVSPAEFLAEPR
ncbi:MAG: hypothetical protein ABR592_13180 [Nitriliruptorales bacterium]